MILLLDILQFNVEHTSVIYYVSQPAHTYTSAVVLLWYGDKLRPLFRFVPYDALHLLRDAGPGVVIWTDFDRLSQSELAIASEARTRLARDDLTHLNDPLRSEQRFDMLVRLHREGINDFAVRRPDQNLDDLHYPVFVRDEVGASNKTPPLLPDRVSLNAAIAALPSSSMIRPMIVEFCGQRGADGCYRKFGAYRIGERIFPQHCFIDTNWFVKNIGVWGPEHRAEHKAYVDSNPHASKLRVLFDDAHIEYGRIDYTLLDERLQVFEINTNPTVLSKPPTPSDSYDQRPYAERHIEALQSLPNAMRSACHATIDQVHNWILDHLRRQYSPHTPYSCG